MYKVMFSPPLHLVLFYAIGSLSLAFLHIQSTRLIPILHFCYFLRLICVEFDNFSCFPLADPLLTCVPNG
uniref:Uncharacterized protein n=1 Tax=Arundo donax TaxID=35708 RepID=A0A0A9DBU6_ARUDO